MGTIKTRNAIFLSAGSLTLASILLSRFNKRWLVLGGLTGVALVQAGFSGFSFIAYLLEKHGITRPDYGHYEEERLKNIHKFKVIKKMRKIRREIQNQIQEAEIGKGV